MTFLANQIPIAIRIRPILVFATCSVLLMMSCGSPSDNDQIERFRQNRAQFEQLVRMAREDNQIRRIGTSRETLQRYPDLSYQRWELYREIMTDLDVRAVYHYQDDQEIRIPLHSFGLVTGGSTKGVAYSYSNKAKTPLYDSLEKLPGIESSVPCYRRIPREEHWYLFFIWFE